MLHPVNGYVVLKPYKESATKSGILLPENTREKPMRGTVVSTEDGKSIGTEVIYSKYGAIDLKYDGESLIVIRERDIIAVINDAV